MSKSWKRGDIESRCIALDNVYVYTVCNTGVIRVTGHENLEDQKSWQFGRGHSAALN